ncbi:MAG: cell division protein FtsZ [Tenuifilaceae bacterium]|jgi:cell division protein FtsZ|nr:cell division protein FtsZ [Tenuifilaceae bacterium]
MADELINFELPSKRSSIIKVVGVGGGGGNAVNHMFQLGIKDVDFVLCNTDSQALINSPVEAKIQLGSSLTEGRGAGNKPEIGRQAAIENIQDVIDVLAGDTKMVFVTAGMGGGTGTGAAPIIAKAAKELGILTVAIVTIPFKNEGKRRIAQAVEGINELESHVDSLLVINNEKIREMYGDLKLSDAFSRADDVLAIAAKGIAEIITVHGYINVDFADVETVMTNSGVAIMGSARSSGPNRAIEAVTAALSSPLLNNNDISGARNILLNITSGSEEITMDEVGQITDYIQAAAGEDADLIWGNGNDSSLGEELNVTVIATGFGTNSIPELYATRKKVDVIPLDGNKSENRLVKQPFFEVKDKPSVKKERGDDKQQRVIEFDLTPSRDPFAMPSPAASAEPEFVVKTTKPEPVAQRPAKATGSKPAAPLATPRSNIDQMEKIPAYVRNNIKLDQVDHSRNPNVSRFILSDDDGEITLRSDNAYLHDNVD